MRPRQNPSRCNGKQKPKTIRPLDVPRMDDLHRAQGFKVLPSRTSDKAEPIRLFGAPGPKRRKHPLVPA